MKSGSVLSSVAVCLIGLTAVSCLRQNTFKKVDTDKGGKLDVAELEVGLAKALHGAGDADRNGTLTQEEWIKVYTKGKKGAFEKYDSDGVHGLSLAETTAALEGEGTFDKLISKIDTNGDGIVDKEEAAVFHDAMEAADGKNDVQKLDNILN